MRDRRLRTLLRRLEWPAVLLIIAAAMFSRLDRVPFHVDESHWIGLSAPFEAFFTGRFSDPIWQDRQDKYITSPVTYYVIGAARRLGGWPAETLNAPFRWRVSYEDNLADNRIPKPGLLWCVPDTPTGQ